MAESVRLSKVIGCDTHHMPLTFICTSPKCNNFRQMCATCVENDIGHSEHHRNRDDAYKTIQSEIDMVFKGLKVLRRKIIHTMETKLGSHNGLQEIEEKLDEIKKMLNFKIDNFHTQLRRIYHNNIREKLNRLFGIVEKSEEFLEEERIRLIKSERLKPFFLNDLTHDLRHFESYYEEILEKNVRRFKAGFEHDRVLKLVVSFEQNLADIFKFNSQYEIEPEPHVFLSTSKVPTIHRMRNSSFESQDLAFLSKPSDQMTSNPQPICALPSIYYSPNDTYYLFGQFRKESNHIRRLQLELKETKNLEVRLHTKRVDFSVCLFNDQIFIVGGRNEKEGCLIKCEKFVPSQGKTYIINSLNQRSAKHSLCNFKDRFILKIGGTDSVDGAGRPGILSPEVYQLETEDWKMVQLPTFGPKSRIDFGLWPGVVYAESADKIIIIEGETGKRKSFKDRYDMFIQSNSEDLKEVKLIKLSLPLHSRNIFFSSCYCERKNDNRMLMVAYDEDKAGIFYSLFEI